MTLARQIRRLLPPGYCVAVSPMTSGHIHVHIAFRQGSYNLTISEPDKPISVENIVANAMAVLG